VNLTFGARLLPLAGDDVALSRDIAELGTESGGMEPATIALMRILAREPEAALRALGRRAA